MVDVRAKGTKAETDIKAVLRKHTKLNWERTPGSGALNEKHGLKGDLYIPNKENLFCVECKHYEEDHLTSKILSGKNPQILEWWKQALRQADQVGRKPLLIFKHNRSKMFVAYEEMPVTSIDFIYLSVDSYELYISLLEEWLLTEQPKFVK
jgi:Holliday junction resolvase